MSATIDAEIIPSAIREYDHWVCWRFEERPGKKPAKLPLNPQTGARADVTESTTWASFTDARAYHENERTDTDGIGFVLTEDDPIVGIDLDDCRDDTGELREGAESIITQIDSYTEYSPSGTGIHVLLMGSLGETRTRHGGVEIYENARFLTVTSDHVSGTAREIHERQEMLEAVYSAYIGFPTYKPSEKAFVETTGSLDSGTPLSDEEILTKAKAAKNGEKFENLRKGNIARYTSHSEADAAFCCLLAYWSQKNPVQMDRMFRQSGLMRAKWDEQRGDRTYGERTIQNTIAMVENTYNNENDDALTTTDTSAQTTESTKPTIEDVKTVVSVEFDEKMWDVVEAHPF